MAVRACDRSSIFLGQSNIVILSDAQFKRIQAMQKSLAIGQDGMDADVWDALISEIHTFLDGFRADQRESLKSSYLRDLPEKS